VYEFALAPRMRPMWWLSSFSTSSAHVLGQSWGHVLWTMVRVTVSGIEKAIKAWQRFTWQRGMTIGASR
jgi:hypothetical protein